jgi:hypothetical protein
MLKQLITISLLTLTLSVFAANTNSSNMLANTFSSETDNLKPEVVQLALKAYDNVEKKGMVHNKQYITIIDYSMPSSEKRLWVLDIKNQKVVYNTYVAHGKNSGENYSTKFSDSPKSQESSIGVYVTKGTYEGHNGNSLVLAGLDKGFNDLAESRRIVMHPAPYVDENILENYGRIGRSWGCPALNPQIAQPIINTIKGGSVMLVYYPDPKWLQQSSYLQG